MGKVGLGLKDKQPKKGTCAADETVALFSGFKGKFAWSVTEEERDCDERNWEGKMHAMVLIGFLK